MYGINVLCLSLLIIVASIVGVFYCSMFCCASLYVHSRFAITLLEKRELRAGCFAWFVFLVSRYCCVALSRGAMGLSAVCDCGIS